MNVYRIAKAKNIYDLSGAGARIAGGRWNFSSVFKISKCLCKPPEDEAFVVDH